MLPLKTLTPHNLSQSLQLILEHLRPDLIQTPHSVTAISLSGNPASLVGCTARCEEH